MFKADEYRIRIKALASSLEETAQALDLSELAAQLNDLKCEQEKPEVWQDLERSKKIGREISSIENKLGAYEKSKKAVDDVNEVVDLIEETGEEELVAELENLLQAAEADVDEMRIRALLRGKYDNYNALLTLHSGAGGQHVNKTESAIRIQHIPSGIVVSCQNERSQIQNREMAMKMLRSKLIELRESERMEKEQNIKGEIKKIEWGSQIRSYVFCPYTLAKDHRTGFESGNIQAVMDGDIEPFIVDYLKKS